jgi:hypothetical protein
VKTDHAHAGRPFDRLVVQHDPQWFTHISLWGKRGGLKHAVEEARDVTAYKGRNVDLGTPEDRRL